MPTRRAPVRGWSGAWWPFELYRSALGKKYVTAVTGLIGLVFVFFHMVGNLKAYLGPLDVDHYSEFLRELLVPLLPRTLTLWLLRSVLIAAISTPAGVGVIGPAVGVGVRVGPGVMVIGVDTTVKLQSLVAVYTLACACSSKRRSTRRATSNGEIEWWSAR